MTRRLIIVAALVVGLAGGGVLGFIAEGQPAGRMLPPIAPARPQPLPPSRPVVPDTLLAWTPGGLPPALEARVRALHGVDHVSAVLSGTAWMTRSFDAQGRTRDRPPAGLAIPLEVAAADLNRYAPFLSPGDRSLLPALARGQAALGSSSATLRRLGPDATLAFGAVRIRVAGVLPDTSIGAHEVFVSKATAARLGVTRPRYLLIDPVAGASRARITTAIRRFLPVGTRLRVRGPGETPYFRQGDAVLPEVRMKQLFGEFAARPLPNGFFYVDPRWVATHIVLARVPILGRVQCNRALIAQLRGALADIARAGLAHLIDPHQYGGCYAPRYINATPGAGLSHHSWGAAIDLNVGANPYGRTPQQDPRLVAIFERWGFTWGGRWEVPDGMHFEFARFSAGT